MLNLNGFYWLFTVSIDLDFARWSPTARDVQKSSRICTIWFEKVCAIESLFAE